MPRTYNPSSNRNEIDSDDESVDDMPLKSHFSNNFTQYLTQSKKRTLTEELSQMIKSVNKMKQKEVANILNESYQNNDVEQFNDLIQGLFKGHQNYNSYYLSLKKYDNKSQKNSNKEHGENEFDDEDDAHNKANSKKGKEAFMNKSILFFVEWTKLINANHTTKEQESWTKHTISIYLDVISVMPLCFYAHNAYHIVQSLEISEDSSSKSFCLLSDLMISLKHSHKIELNLIDRETMNGQEFESFIVECICTKQWKIENDDDANNECSQQMVINVLECLKNLDLNNEESMNCFCKIMNVLQYVKYSYLPSAIYHLLMLGQKRNLLMILKYIFTFFYDLDAQKNEDINLWLQQKEILHHFVYVSSQSQNVCSHTIKLLKNRLIRLDAFSFSVLLSIASIRKYKDKIMRFLMTYITQYFEYNQIAKKYEFADIDNDVFYSPIWSIFERVLYRSIRGKWDLCIPSLVELGFSLIDNGETWPQSIHFSHFMQKQQQPRQREQNGHSNGNGSHILTQKIHNHLTQHVRGHILRKTEIARNLMDLELTQKECIGFAGCYILKMLFFVQTYLSNDIINKILKRITHFSENSNHGNINSSLHLLQILASKKQSHFIKDAMVKKLELYFEEFTSLPPLVAIGFMHSLNPIIELQPQLSDKMLYVLRKMLFSPNQNIRILGVEGFISVLQHTKTGGFYSKNAPKKPTYSQRFGALRMSQSIINNPRQHLCLEIIRYLHRALKLQTMIRERAYFGIYRLIQCDEFDNNLIIDVLLDQLKIYYMDRHMSSAKNIHIPLNFYKCFDENEKEKIMEPLPGLIMICCELLFWYASNDYDFDELYTKMKDEYDGEKKEFLASLPVQIASLFELKLMIDDIVRRLSLQKLNKIKFERENEEYFEKKEEMDENEKHNTYRNGMRYLMIECCKLCSHYALRLYLLHKNDEKDLKNGINLVKKCKEIHQNDKKNKFKYCYKGELNKNYFSLNAYLSASNVLKLECIQNKKEIDLLRLFAIENMCIYLKIASKHLNDAKNVSIRKKKRLWPIIQNIVPYYGTVGCYDDDRGGISKLMQLILSIFGSLLAWSLEETSSIATKRNELAKDTNSDNDDDSDKDEEDKKEKKPLTKLNKREKENEISTECLRFMIDIAMNANNTMAYELLLSSVLNEDDENEIKKKAIKKYEYMLMAVQNAHNAGLTKLPLLWATIFYKMTLILKAQYDKNDKIMARAFIRSHKLIGKLTLRNGERDDDEMAVCDKNVLKYLLLSDLEILSIKTVAKEDFYQDFVADIAKV